MGKKRIQLPKDIKSIHSAGIRSIPKALRSPYLELYTLSNEEKRLERESGILSKKKATVDGLLESVNDRMEKLKKEISKEGKAGIYKSAKMNSAKTMSVNY